MILGAAGDTLKRLILERRYWAIPIALWSVLVSGSLLWNWFQLEQQVQGAALNRARFVFKMVESVRLWNARHGGVYAPITEETAPNPHLEVPERDIATPSGQRLTMINPAYMTRQLSAVVDELADVRLHLTSLKPINPDNQPDEWERRALEAFESDISERRAFVDQDGVQIYRYMAPLVTDEACLQCHEKQGYKVGDIRGGVSIAFAAKPLTAPIAEGQRRITMIHLGIWALLSAFTVFSMARFRAHMLSLNAAKARQEQMVLERTAELRTEVRDRQKAEAQLRLLIESSGEAIIGVDHAGRCMLCNPEALRVLGYEETSEVVGRDIFRLLEHSHKDDTPRKPADSALRPAYHEGRPVHVDGYVFWRADGTPFPVELRAHPLRAGNEVIGAVITFADITERKNAQDRVWRQANYDGLTGLVNRRLFYDRLDQHLKEARRTANGFGLLYIDLDGFKEVNDRYGHETGDALLQEVARRLEGAVRSSDTVARMGGDEFTVIVAPVNNRTDLQRIADALAEAVNGVAAVGGVNTRLGASVGMALYPEDGDRPDDLLRQADQAMYAEKRRRRAM